MIAVIQRVLSASVTIDEEIYSNIDKGLLILLGVKKGDTEKNSKLLAQKILDLRIFKDENDKMNLSVKDVKGEVLVISQFTLCTDSKSGNRPGFTAAEMPERANLLYELNVIEMQELYERSKIKTGIFAAKMEVKLINDGPVTIILEKN